MTPPPDPPFFNPLQEGYLEDPWPHLAEMRDVDPVHQLLTGQWGLFRYEDVFRLLRDPTLSVADENVDFSVLERSARLDEVDDELRSRSILNIDPPDHTRLRGLVVKAFDARRVERMRERIRDIANRLVDLLLESDHADLVRGFNHPLPVIVICDMLGVPESDRAGFIEETGAAQFMRDVRIAAIYEGTNGIQAIDLVMRKLPLSDGEAMAREMARMRATVDALRASNNPQFGAAAERLEQTLERLRNAEASESRDPS